MRPAIFVFLTLIVSPESVSGQTRDLSTVVSAALSWHYRWIEPLPKTSISVTCLFTPFPKQSFAFCEPLSLSMHIDNGSTTGLNVSFLNSEPHSHEAALKEFRRNINAAPPSGPTTLLTFSADDLATCSVDTKMTEYAASAVLTSDLRGMLHSKGLTFRYPMICTGDPFYLLFAFRGNELSWVWVYAIEHEQFQLRWSFEPGNEQRRVPRQALRNLNNKDLWYAMTR